MSEQTSVNVPNLKTDQTVRIFDQFYTYEAEVPRDEYDIVRSFFLSVFSNNLAADNFTVTLFRVAQESQTSVLDLLQQLQGQPEMQLNATLCYYINGLRSLTTLLGVSQPILPNYYAARNVMQ